MARSPSATAFSMPCIRRCCTAYVAADTLMRGWALVEQGQGEKGCVQLREGLAAYRAMGAELGLTQYLALLADAEGRRDKPVEGLRVLEEALARVNKTEEHFYEAELYRLTGELSLKSGVRSPESEITDPRPLTPDPQAEACFHQAIEIVRRQQAKSWELRAVMSLARLWQQQGKRVEARQMLAEVYGWFTEGFDTADLREAKRLLVELS